MHQLHHMPVWQFCVDDAVRHAAMKQSLSIVEPNLEVVEQVVHQRHDTAKVMGFDSYAELTMRDRIMQSPQVGSYPRASSPCSVTTLTPCCASAGSIRHAR